VNLYSVLVYIEHNGYKLPKKTTYKMFASFVCTELTEAGRQGVNLLQRYENFSRQ